jgi:hypothetical protein
MAQALPPGALTAEGCGSGGRERIQHDVGRGSAEAAMTDELAFKVVRINGTYEVLSRCVNLTIARGAYREAARMYPEDKILLCQGTRVIERSR